MGEEKLDKQKRALDRQNKEYRLVLYILNQ
jgi:hypothetical protein